MRECVNTVDLSCGRLNWLLTTCYTGWPKKISHYRELSSNRINTQLTGQLADKPTHGQSSRGLDNSRTGQLADNEFLENIKLLYFICTLNLTLTLTLTLSNIGSV